MLRIIALNKWHLPLTFLGDHDDWCSCEKCQDMSDVEDIVDYLPRETRVAYYAKKQHEALLRAATGSNHSSPSSAPPTPNPDIEHKEILKDEDQDKQSDSDLQPVSIRSKILQLENATRLLHDAKADDISEGVVENNFDNGSSHDGSETINEMEEPEIEANVAESSPKLDDPSLNLAVEAADDDVHHENELLLLNQERARLEEEVERIQVPAYG